MVKRGRRQRPVRELLERYGQEGSGRGPIIRLLPCIMRGCRSRSAVPGWYRTRTVMPRLRRWFGACHPRGELVPAVYELMRDAGTGGSLPERYSAQRGKERLPGRRRALSGASQFTLRARKEHPGP
jgi:hypothetical protein